VAPALVFIGLALGLHTGLMLTGFRGDQLLLPLVVALCAVGLVVVYRVAPPEVALRQLVWMSGGIGLLTLSLLLLRDPPVLRRYTYTWALAGIGLLVLTLLFGRDLNGSGQRLWLDLRLFQIQPTELVKVLLVLFLAGYLEEHREMLSQG